MNPHPLTPAIADIESRIQDLYREKGRLEQQRDAENAPALIALLISSGTMFALHHTYLGRADIVINGRAVDAAIIAYIADFMTNGSKPVAADLHIHWNDGEGYLDYQWNIGQSESRVPQLLAALKALGIPKHLISVADYEREVVNHERNRARTQVDLDKVRELVAAY